MLLYVHVPFCVGKCGYCAFHSGLFSPSDAARFVDLVVREMARWAQTLGPRPVRTIYFGGGTPSLLTVSQLGRILDHVVRSFSVLPDAEITLEANPESAIRSGFFKQMETLGINRLSLGVQSLQDELLQVLGRPHDSRQARLAMDRAVAAFSNVSVDLIWGLPGQRLDHWMGDLAQTVAAGPQHFSLYGLSLEEGTALQEAVNCGRLTIPDDEECVDMYSQAVSYLQAEGFLQYEVSNFSLSGCESRHNAGYWSGLDYLGLGPGAVSTMGERRWVNPPNLTAYERLILTGQGARETEHLSAEVRRREMVMLALRTRQGLDLNKFKAMAGRHLKLDQNPAVERLRSSGLIHLSTGHLQLTSAGMLVSNSIIELVLDLLDGAHDDTGHL